MFRHSSHDRLLVALAAAHGIIVAALFAFAEPLVAAVGFGVTMWWASNTISHNHLHNPLFRSSALNCVFSFYLSLLLGVPQRLWRVRHLWHHAGEPTGRSLRLRGSQAWIEIALVACLGLVLLLLAPRLFLYAYLPGYLVGLGLCALQGHYEHLGQVDGISHYGALYNRVWFNDGFHIEHHRWPGEHWSRLPLRRTVSAGSPLPPVLRWIGGGVALALGWLERCALASSALQHFLVETHLTAFTAVWPALLSARGGSAPARVGIVGGGLFPRTALALRRLAPTSQLVIIDASPESIEGARTYLRRMGAASGIQFVCARWEAHGADPVPGLDLLVIPLAFVGDRAAVYARGRRPRLVHDWIWRRRGAASAIVSPLLLKRLNLIL